MRLALVVLVAACRLSFDARSDGGASGDASGDGIVVDAPRSNLVFVTSTIHDLCQIGAAGADAACQARATAGGLPGTFIALASDATTNVRERLAGARGWRRVDGKPFADRLFATPEQIWYPPRIDEFGGDVGQSTVASGTQSDGTHEPNTGCMLGGFSSNSGIRWFTSLVVAQSRLICLSTDYTTPVTIQPTSGRFAFVSVTNFNPSTGIAAADTLCNNDAATASLPGTYRALLTTTTAAAATRFDTSGPTWVRRDGLPVFATATDLVPWTLELPIDRDALGAATSSFTWSGNRLSSTSAATCNDWSMRTNTLAGVMWPATESSTFGFTTVPQGCAVDLPVLCLQE